MKSKATVLAMSALAMSACGDSAPTATAPVFEVAPAMSVAANGGRNATAALAGANEVPAVATTARGQASFHLSEDGTELSYRLIVANIDNAVASHIHLAPPGVNGPVVALLFGPAPPAGGRSDGVIAVGTITGDDLVGPLAGEPLSALMAAIVSGGTYVNVHTNDGVAPTNTGAGDVASGEIRGQIN